MPDITMCQDHQCPDKEKCYRYMANPNGFRQSYFVGSPREADGSCHHYWEMSDDSDKKKEND